MQRECRLRGDRGSWTERSAGETRSREERLRGRTADRLNGDPQAPDPGNTGEGRPPRRPFLTGRPLVMARLYGNDFRNGLRVVPGPGRPGGLRTVVMERILWNDFRNGLRVVPGPGRPGREGCSTSKVAER